MTEFFEYAERHGFALFPLRPGTKDPFKDWEWTTDIATERTAWTAWTDTGNNLAINAGKSRLIVVDIDVKELGRDRAWALWCSWCTDHGLDPADYPAHVQTCSLGWHIYFTLPASVDPQALSQRKLVKRTEGSRNAIVETRAANGYVVAPGGHYDGARGGVAGPYALLSENAPYSAPDALIAACALSPPADTATAHESSIGSGSFDLADISGRIDFLIDQGYFDEEETWVKSVRAIRHGFGDDGWSLAERISYADDQKRLDGVWARQETNTTNPSTCATMIGESNDRGYRQWRRDHMFDGIFADDILSPPLAPTGPLPAGMPIPGPCEIEDEAEPRALAMFTAASLHGLPTPVRKWHVRDWLPGETVSLLYGDGGVGKSLLALQLLVSTAIGRPWLGRMVEQGVCLFVTAEDSKQEVHMRLADVARENSVPLSAIGDLHILPLAGEDAILAAPDGRSGILLTTALFALLEEQLMALRPKLVVLDTLADLFGGNEVDRSQARQFIGLMRGWALKYDSTVLLLAHPSVAGMAKGTGSSGSTGWSNSVRSRLYFDRIRAEDNSEPDPDARVLRSMKSNYGRVGDEIVVRYRSGVFAPDHVTAGSGDPMATSAKADRVFLELLRKYLDQNRHVSTSEGKSYAPFIFQRDAALQGVSKRALKDAMERLLASGKIENAPHGAPSKKMYRLYVAAASPANALLTPAIGVPTV
jgi:RecA-family ATPase